MKITAKEILADKGNIYKNMSEEELYQLTGNVIDYDQFVILHEILNVNIPHARKVAKKLWQRWHYKDGRPKPPRVHEVTRLRNELEEAYKKIMELKYERVDSINRNIDLGDKNADLKEKLRNYQSETSQKNIQIINLQGELSKAHNTTKIVAFVSLVIILGLILIP